jgi:hypothetical protein
MLCYIRLDANKMKRNVAIVLLVCMINMSRGVVFVKVTVCMKKSDKFSLPVLPTCRAIYG